MSFAARQQELVQRLQWAPTRGPRRQALLDELRALVRDELRREVATARTDPPTTHSHVRAPRPFYWLDQDDDEAHP